MAKIKVTVLLPLVMDDKSFGHGDEVSLDQKVAYDYALQGVVEFKTKKAFDELDRKLKQEAKEKAEEEAKKEAEIEAILYREKLLEEKEKLLTRINEINETLEITELSERYNLPEDELLPPSDDKQNSTNSDDTSGDGE